MKVWTLIINNRHGTYVSVYHQYKNAEKELLEYVETHWNSEYHGDFDALAPDKAIEAYFGDSYEEWYELDEALVMDAEKTQ